MKSTHSYDLKLIRTLRTKKGRKSHGLFIAEGTKTVQELCASDLNIKWIFHTADQSFEDERSVQITSKDMQRISALKTPPGILAVAEIPSRKPAPIKGEKDHRIILEDIQDPGNLGTIIRTAEWFGVSEVICSTNTVDAFNPKVIQASMGSVFRLAVRHADLTHELDQLKSNGFEIYATLLDGDPLNEISFPDHCGFTIGSESHGLSEAQRSMADKTIFIPGNGAESLNAAMACGIVLWEMNR